MSDYERSTVLPTREVFAKAHDILTSRAELQQVFARIRTTDA